MSDKNKAAMLAREFLRSETKGVLSTQSRVLKGYPFGSVVPYCLDGDGFPVILISHVAQHTHNIEKDSKVSLTITQPGVDDVQTGARLTWVGNAEQVDNDLSAQRYYRFFPESRDYHKTHNFSFYRIVPVRSRYIGGFGDIYWLSNELMVESNHFAGETECELLIQLNESGDSELVGIDSRGVSLRVENKMTRIAFGKTAQTADEMKSYLAEAIKLQTVK